MSHGLTLTRTERQILKTLSNLTQLFSQISRDNVPRQKFLEGSVMCSKHATFKLIRRPQDGADKNNPAKQLEFHQRENILTSEANAEQKVKPEYEVTVICPW